jgi:hypothetical protein
MMVASRRKISFYQIATPVPEIMDVSFYLKLNKSPVNCNKLNIKESNQRTIKKKGI